MRSDKELIQILLDSEDVFVEEGCEGLCEFIRVLAGDRLIIFAEKVRLRFIILDNKPKKTYNSDFYFPPYQWQPRKEFLERIIETL
jgi:hypothetical protein